MIYHEHTETSSLTSSSYASRTFTSNNYDPYDNSLDETRFCFFKKLINFVFLLVKFIFYLICMLLCLWTFLMILYYNVL